MSIFVSDPYNDKLVLFGGVYKLIFSTTHRCIFFVELDSAMFVNMCKTL